jgi:hypothetical protein
LAHVDEDTESLYPAGYDGDSNKRLRGDGRGGGGGGGGGVGRGGGGGGGGGGGVGGGGHGEDKRSCCAEKGGPCSCTAAVREAGAGAAALSPQRNIDVVGARARTLRNKRRGLLLQWLTISREGR